MLYLSIYLSMYLDRDSAILLSFGLEIGILDH
jgi:hypothetical protein